MSKTYNVIKSIEENLTTYFGTEAKISQWLPSANENDPFEKLAKKAMTNGKTSIFIVPTNARATVKGERKPLPFDLQSVDIIAFVPMSQYETNALPLFEVEDKIKASLIAFAIPQVFGDKKRIELELTDTDRRNTAYGTNFVLQSMITYQFGIIIDGTIEATIN